MIRHVIQITLLFLLNSNLSAARSDVTATTTDHFVSPTANAIASVGRTFAIEWIITTESDPSPDGEDYDITLFRNEEKFRILDSESM